MAKRRLTSISLTKIAAVDNPCQVGAQALITKRAPGPLDIAKVTFQEALDGQLIARRVSDAFYGAFDNMWQRNDAFRTALTDEIAEGGNGETAANAYIESIKSLADHAIARIRENGGKPTDEELAKSFTDAAQEWLTKQQKEPQMPKFTTTAALSAAIAKFAPATSTVQDQADIMESAAALGAEGAALLPATGPIAKAEPKADPEIAKMQRELSILKMAPEIRKHFDGLADDAQTAFLAKSATEQADIVKAANATDPVVYKCADGTEIRKSAGDAVLMMAKRMDQQDATIKRLSEENGAASITKRAAEFKHLPNAEAIIKAHDALPEADRAAFMESQRAADKALAPAFKRMGIVGGLDIEKGDDTPEGKMAAIVKRIADTDKISEAQATVKAASDPEYQAAYAESVASPAAA